MELLVLGEFLATGLVLRSTTFHPDRSGAVKLPFAGAGAEFYPDFEVRAFLTDPQPKGAILYHLDLPHTPSRPA